MAIDFERESLYLEVWSTPMTHLGKKYGLSDNGLRKVCKALAIPTPVHGHWAKIAAGHKIQPLPLPQHSGPTKFISHPAQNLIDPPATTEKEWLAEKIQFEKDPVNKIEVLPDLSSPHPLIAQTLRAVCTQRDAILKDRKEEERRRALPAKNLRGQPNYSALTSLLHAYRYRGELLELPADVISVRVSVEKSERALIILDALIKAAKIRGISSRVEKRRLILELDKIRIQVRITERQEVVKIPQNEISSLDYSLGKTERKIPTGDLRLFLCASGTESKFSDAPGSLLEGQINEIFVKIYKIVVRDKAYKAWLDERIKADAVKQIERDEQQRQDLEAKRQREEEAKLREKLFEEAALWGQSKILREYANHIEALARAPEYELAADEVAQWLQWAREVANHKDPSIKLLSKLMDQCSVIKQ